MEGERVEISKKEEYEKRKAQKLEEKGKIKRSQNLRGGSKKTLKYVVVLVLIVLVGYGIIVAARRGAPQGEDFSQSFPSVGREHVPDNSPRSEYNSNPPSSGSHYGSPARTGFYSEPLPDENVIHNLEHGDIWIAYKPDLGEEILDRLEDFAGRFVIVTPREANDFDISVVAWARVDGFNVDALLDEENEERIKDFIKRYDDKGLEKVRAGSIRPSSPI